MKKMWGYIWMLLLLVPVNGFSMDVSVQVDKTRISEKDAVLFSVIIKGGKGNVDTSPIRDFKVIPRGTSTSVNIVNQNYSRTLTHRYVLVPRKQGRLKIPPLVVTNNGETYKTREILIEVSERADSEHEPEKIFARAFVSKNKLFQGEQCIYTFKFYTRVNFSRANLEEPSFSGFLAREAGERKKYEEQVQGISYRVTEINYLLVPETTGRLTIEPAEILCEIPVKDSRDPFGSFFSSNSFFSTGSSETLKVATSAEEVHVNALPPYRGSGVFSGLVGAFDIQAALDKNKVMAGDSATFTIVVSGTGNVMDAALPEISFPESFKVYDDDPEKKVQVGLKGYVGEKIFKKAIVPVKPGSFAIDPIPLVWFDVNTKAYKTAFTDPLSLVVDPSTAPESDGGSHLSDKSGNRAMEKQQVQLTGHDILDLKEETDVLVSKTSLGLETFLLLLMLPGVVFFLLKGILLFSKQEESQTALMEKRAQTHLKKACAHDLDQKTFLRFLYSALVARILSLASAPGENLTSEEVRTILLSRNYSSDIVTQASEMLSDIESARYSGRSIDTGERKRMLKQLNNLFKKLGSVVLICIFLSMGSVSARADDNTTLFLKGVEAYRSGNYAASARIFETIAKNGVENPKLYYNIGNACLKAEDTGRAILWYERAKKYIPNDADLRFNLEYANSFVKDKKEGQALKFDDILFFWQDILPARYIQYGALFCSLVFFSYAAVRTLKRKRIFTWSGTAAFTLLMIVVLAALFDYYDNNMNPRAVILPREVHVRSGTSDKATVLFTLHAGTKVKVEKKHNGYLRIFFAKGKIGWVQQKDCGII
ncbi:MAG: BatD family protein [Desulfobacteraceae bacterium]